LAYFIMFCGTIKALVPKINAYFMIGIDLIVLVLPRNRQNVYQNIVCFNMAVNSI
jgi:hypothetical protein